MRCRWATHHALRIHFNTNVVDIITRSPAASNGNTTARFFVKTVVESDGGQSCEVSSCSSSTAWYACDNLILATGLEQQFIPRKFGGDDEDTKSSDHSRGRDAVATVANLVKFGVPYADVQTDKSFYEVALVVLCVCWWWWWWWSG